MFSAKIDENLYLVDKGNIFDRGYQVVVKIKSIILNFLWLYQFRVNAYLCQQKSK